MQIWTVSDADILPIDLYELGLAEVDSESQARIKRFYHQADSNRCLIGRLLPRIVLNQHGIARDDMAFGKTPSGKPFISVPNEREKIGFNISHDRSFVVMAVQTADDSGSEEDRAADITMIGVDVMKAALPHYERTLKGFVESIRDTLTELECTQLLDTAITQTEGLRRLFLMWTVKEAYTKALGIGLGFNFNRIQYDVLDNRLTVDGVVLRGWQFVAFSVVSPRGNEGIRFEGSYQIVAARFVGSDEETHVEFRHVGHHLPWLLASDASTIVREALRRLCV